MKNIIQHLIIPKSQARLDFIDKFFTALGWDVNHAEQKNPYEQEVKVERKVKDKEAQKRADYAFFLKPNYRDPKFFVEAKKPSRSLANPYDYFQAIRYGWNAQTPIHAFAGVHINNLISYQINRNKYYFSHHFTRRCWCSHQQQNV